MNKVKFYKRSLVTWNCSSAWTLRTCVLIPFESWMSVGVSSVLSWDGLIIQGDLPTAYEIHNFRLILVGKQARLSKLKEKEQELSKSVTDSPGSNLNRHTDFPYWGFFVISLQATAVIFPWIRPRPLPLTYTCIYINIYLTYSFNIQYSLSGNQQLKATYSMKGTASLKKLKLLGFLRDFTRDRSTEIP